MNIRVEIPTARMAIANLRLLSGQDQDRPESHVIPGAAVVGFIVRRGHE